MIEDLLIKSRRILRFPKQIILDRTPREILIHNISFLELITPYLDSRHILLYALDHNMRTHILRDRKKEEFEKLITTFDHSTQSPVRQHIYLGQESQIHYFDVDYINKKNRLYVITRFEVQKRNI